MLLSLASTRLGLPYAAVLAVGGAGLALVPGIPAFTLPPDLALALFVAPILLDAAFDTSLRDLRANWAPVAGLVVGAVLSTTLAVALIARWLDPGLPWAAAIALGAIVAPPDAAAATTILRTSSLPRRLKVILEGESLLNDASALIILRLATLAVAGGITLSEAVPEFLLATLGSLVAGPTAAWAYHRTLHRITDVPSAVLLQFIGTFGVWIVAERLHLSAILTVVLYGMTLARLAPDRTPARLRVPSYAVWETATFFLSVLAFALIGLQIRPILIERLDASALRQALSLAAVVLGAVILVRVAWVMSWNAVVRWRVRRQASEQTDQLMRVPTIRGGLIVSWAGMRGVVTIAAALSLPESFPGRDAIVLSAFATVLGTLVIQGCTLATLVRWLALPDDGQGPRELALARRTALEAALAHIDGDRSPAAEALRAEYRERLELITRADDGQVTIAHDTLRHGAVQAARRALSRLRRADEIGDDAFHAVEEDLDWLELASKRADGV